MSPGIECLRQEAAAANSSASAIRQAAVQAVDQAGCKRITGADPIDDIGDFVTLADEKLAAIMQAG